MGKRKSCKGKLQVSDFTVTHYGTDGVTGTCLVLEIPREELKIMLDCGFYQDSTLTSKQQFDINAKKFKDLDLSTITHVLVTHSHLDHCGALGILMTPESGFNGKIMCTEASQPLIMLNVKDSAFVMQQTCKMYNKANPSKKPLEPLYLESHANELILNLRGYGYNDEIQLTPNVHIQFKPCGHLLGDASILIEYQKDEYTTRRLLFTGDTNAFCQSPRPFTKQWEEEELEIDTLIMENTYSGRFHEKRDTYKELEEYVMNHVVKNKGILLIPAFAIGRSSQVVYYLHEIWKNNPEFRKANVPVYLAGMMLNASHNTYANPYYRQHYMDEEWAKSECFTWGNIKKISKFPEVEEQLTDNKCKIIIASSGMVQGGGYSVYLCQQLLGRPNVMTLFCGYQGVATGGRSIMEAVESGKNVVTLQGKKYTIRCQVPKPISLSGHGDERQLIKLVKSLHQGKLKHIILVHGDEEAKSHMKKRLEQELDMDKKTIHIPQIEETIRMFNNNK